jgi:hypothetical protein
VNKILLVGQAEFGSVSEFVDVKMLSSIAEVRCALSIVHHRHGDSEDARREDCVCRAQDHKPLKLEIRSGVYPTNVLI